MKRQSDVVRHTIENGDPLGYIRAAGFENPRGLLALDWFLGVISSLDAGMTPSAIEARMETALRLSDGLHPMAHRLLAQLQEQLHEAD